jgi:cytochrome c peroxidase
MKISAAVALSCAVVVALWTGACRRERAPAIEPNSPKLKVFGRLPEVMASEKNPITEEKVRLGRMLYYDTRLSKSQTLSCNSCHKLEAWGVDNQPTSEGHKGQHGDRNSPTVYNAAGHVAQFWDGRAADVEEQAKGPVLNPVEMAMPSEKYVLEVLKSMPGYVEAFRAAFPGEKDPVTYDNFARAVGAFERKLVTPSRWDRFLAGDAAALTAAEKKGLEEFLTAGCQTCHMGPYVGGSMFQKLGVVKPWPDESDLGRFKVTSNPADRFVFKVPSLRNVAKTGPYFHNGKVATLNEAVRLMAEYELGLELKPAQIEAIVTFLNALTGELPADYIRPPELPASTEKTPKPDLSD